MANNLGSLVVSLGLDAADFTKGMTKAEYEAFKSTEAIKAQFQTIGKYVAGLGLGAVFVQAVRNTADYADEIGKLAQKAGTTAEDISKLSYAARQADVDNGQLAKALRALGEDALAGGEKLAALGIKVTDASGKTKTSAQLFSEVAEAISAMEDPQRKAAAAAELLGAKVGPELIPLLNQGAGGLKDMADEAQRFGRVVNDEAVRSAEAFNDNLTKLQEAGAGLAGKLAGPLIQSLADASTYFIKVANDVGIAKASLISFGAAFARALGLDDVGRISSQAKANANAVALTVKQIETFQRLADAGDAGAAARVGQLREQYQKLQTEGQKITGLLKSEAADIEAGFTPVKGAPLGDLPGKPAPAKSGGGRKVAGSGKDPILEANEKEAGMLKLLADLEQKRIEAARQGNIQELADLEKRNTAYQENVQSLVDATPTKALDRQRETMALLAEEYERGRFGAAGSAEAIALYGETVNTYLGNLTTGLEQTNATANQAGEIFGGWLERAITDGGKLSDVINGLIRDLALLALRKAVIEPAVTGFTNLIGGAIGSFDGGGYTGRGSRSGGVDGKGGFPAILHPNETVIDHTRGGGMGGGVTVVNNIDARGADASVLPQLEQMLKASESRTKSDIMNSINRGGAWARATGRA